MDSKELILDRYEKIQKVVENYPSAICIAVSKRQEQEKIQVLVEVGHKDFGENYLQEWESKKENFSKSIRWHFIGQTQSRKVKPMVESGIYSIHSLGSESSLSKWNALPNKSVGPSFLQVNLEGETQKGGVSYDLAKKLKGEGKLESIQGLMTIPPFGLDKEILRAHFKKMRHLCDELKLPELSMGMSSDWQMALEEGSTCVRVGTGIFGKRLS